MMNLDPLHGKTEMLSIWKSSAGLLLSHADPKDRVHDQVLLICWCYDDLLGSRHVPFRPLLPRYAFPPEQIVDELRKIMGVIVRTLLIHIRTTTFHSERVPFSWPIVLFSYLCGRSPFPWVPQILRAPKSDESNQRTRRRFSRSTYPDCAGLRVAQVPEALHYTNHHYEGKRNFARRHHTGMDSISAELTQQRDGHKVPGPDMNMEQVACTGETGVLFLHSTLIILVSL